MEWVYCPEQSFIRNSDYLDNNEVFLSDHTENKFVISANMIDFENGPKCQVISESTYKSLSEFERKQGKVLFYRYKYIRMSHAFVDPIPAAILPAQHPKLRGENDFVMIQMVESEIQ